MDPQNNKKHQRHSSGAKFNKKKADNKDKAKERGPSTKENNPKAFAIRSAVSAGQKLRRKLDLEVRKHHAPVLDRQQVSDTAAPFLVAIVGPPKSGKTTLIQSLVKHWTKKKIQEIKGPITIITGKNRRVTLFECPNNLNSMIDIAKVADLVLLLVDASFGFEMETFEFLNILQVHGFPKVMGVLTHLDLVKKSSALRRIKKDIKHRFWKEICKGAKVFYLSGIVFGKYLQREVINLSRFISVLRFKPSVWRSTHAGILVDRIEDITPEDQIMRDSTCDRRVCMYGFVRGTYLKKEQRVVVPGCGEFSMKSIVGLEDPCPLPDDEKKKKKRSLNQKERLLYAPMTDMGEIVYDKDAVYMHVPHKSIESDMHPYIEELAHNTRAIDNTLEETEGEFSFFGGKVSTSKPVEVKEFDQASGRVRRRAVFADETSNNNNDDDDDNVMEEDSDDNLEEDNDDEVPNLPKFDDDNVQEKVEFDDEWTNEDAEIFEESVGDVLDFYKKDNNVGSEAAEWKGNLIEKASERFNANKRVNLQELVYGSQLLSANKKDSEDSESDDELFKPVNSKKQNFDDVESVDEEDITKPLREADDVENDWDSEEARDAIKHKFAPEDWSEYNKEQAANPSRPDANQDDIEDLEKTTPAKKPSKPEANNMDISDSDDDDGNSRKKAKETKKSAFDSEYDNGGVQTSSDADGNSKATAQLLLNKTEFSSMDEFERAQYEGFRPGMYVKIELENMPAEFIIKHNPIHPVLIGGLNSSESRMGFIQVRLKKHRWHRKILKTRDPLIFSIGWRRFQSIPQYCIQDQNGRHRNIKYTPEHMHCIATFYGPVTPQNTGFIAFQTMSDQQSTFRVSATGYVMEFDQNFSIVKKLKLTGSPFKIFKNSAFIRGMFNSTLEVSRFQGAALRTVSGIRGSIKKPITEGVPGSFRAAFEDKILMSDIVFLRTWYPVPPIKFYNPVTNHLSPQWRAMKTVGMLRKERGLAIPRDKDAEYRPIARAPRRVETTAAVQIPRKMREELPFALRPTMDKQADDKTTIRLRQLDYIAPGNDKVKTNKMLKKLQIEATAAEQRRKEVQALKTEKRKKEQEREDMKKQQTIGRKRKAHFVKQGKADKKQKRN